ncbi:RNA recognition motif (RRM)-containing protein [Actinidia rufa]|uniref:RNA recognition motif (RRM)-containing protein n=1 Tax=Actinidia rufa TaxID=165716 RepID=A0A7J0ENW6_9ERIC|nr:RNA recognition motif (RRM)-containing protein [Actinidia rufa]
MLPFSSTIADQIRFLIQSLDDCNSDFVVRELCQVLFTQDYAKFLNQSIKKPWLQSKSGSDSEGWASSSSLRSPRTETTLSLYIRRLERERAAMNWGF